VRARDTAAAALRAKLVSAQAEREAEREERIKAETELEHVRQDSEALSTRLQAENQVLAFLQKPLSQLAAVRGVQASTHSLFPTSLGVYPFPPNSFPPHSSGWLTPNHSPLYSSFHQILATTTPCNHYSSFHQILATEVNHYVDRLDQLRVQAEEDLASGTASLQAQVGDG
jgi:hypothetical protein